MNDYGIGGIFSRAQVLEQRAYDMADDELSENEARRALECAFVAHHVYKTIGSLQNEHDFCPKAKERVAKMQKFMDCLSETYCIEFKPLRRTQIRSILWGKNARR